MAHMLEWMLENLVSLAIYLLEFMGVGVIIWTGINGFIHWVKRAGDTRIYLARGLALGLEFKVGSEILRTVIVREWTELALVGGIIALRAALSLLIHWEIKVEEKREVDVSQ